ncbi:MAG: STAS domain-containing protein [Armatimonadetes bacterium]|nr:STAS domain-containing protein [Armatimonadota bacterium]
METARHLTLAASRRGEQVFIQISGDVDLAGVGKMKSCIEDAVGENVKACIIDCREVTFIDTEALKALLLLKTWFARLGGSFRMENCSKQLVRVLTLLGIREQLGCVEKTSTDNRD